MNIRRMNNATLKVERERQREIDLKKYNELYKQLDEITAHYINDPEFNRHNHLSRGETINTLMTGRDRSQLTMPQPETIAVSVRENSTREIPSMDMSTLYPNIIRSTNINPDDMDIGDIPVGNPTNVVYRTLTTPSVTMDDVRRMLGMSLAATNESAEGLSMDDDDFFSQFIDNQLEADEDGTWDPDDDDNAVPF